MKIKLVKTFFICQLSQSWDKKKQDFEFFEKNVKSKRYPQSLKFLLGVK